MKRILVLLFLISCKAAPVKPFIITHKCYNILGSMNESKIFAHYEYSDFHERTFEFYEKSDKYSIGDEIK